MKPERWGSPLVQEKYREEKACDKRHTYRIIIIIIKKTKNAFLIDTVVPNTHNLAKTITDKQNKYLELGNEICAMWKQKSAQVIPIVISSTGITPKSLSQSLTRLNLHRNTYI